MKYLIVTALLLAGCAHGKQPIPPDYIDPSSGMRMGAINCDVYACPSPSPTPRDGWFIADTEIPKPPPTPYPPLPNDRACNMHGGVRSHRIGDILIFTSNVVVNGAEESPPPTPAGVNSQDYLCKDGATEHWMVRP